MRKQSLISLFICWILILTSGGSVSAQQAIGINFEQGTSLSQALEKAKESQRFVFIDCYTVWCVPCKWMDTHVFNQDTVGMIVNPRFVSLKVDMEKGEGKTIHEKYRVGAFPTFLLLDQQGELLYKFVGAKDVKAFLNEIQIGSIVDNPIARMNKRYELGDRSPSFILELMQQKLTQKENKFAQEMLNNLIDTSSATILTSQESWFIFAKHKNSVYLSYPGSKAFRYFISNWNSFVPNIGLDSVNTRLEESFIQLASDCLRGFYQKQTVYTPSDFNYYRKKLKGTKIKNKKIYLAIIDIAEEACKGNKLAVSDIFADHVQKMSPKGQRLAYDIWSYLSASPVIAIPRLAEISDKILLSSQDQFLRSTAESYRTKKIN